MDRREIVERAIRFDDAPRVPFKFDVVGVNDCYDVWTNDPTGWTWEFEGECRDEWGCLWRRSGVENTGQVVGHPLKDLAAMKDYRWPDPDRSERYKGFEEQLAGAEDRFVMFCFGHGIFERLHMLGGMSETLLNFYCHPKEIHELIERILDHHLRVLDRCARIADGRIHAAAMADDWGVQDRAFISVEFFREFFKPSYKRWFDAIKERGMVPWMHSCGKINTLLEELIDCGLEVINMQQPATVGIEAIGEQFRGRICIESIVDTQTTLPRGTHDEIRTMAHNLLDAWATSKGGFIVSDYNDAEAIGVTLDRRLTMFEAFAEKAGYPDYPRILQEARGRCAASGHSYGRKAIDRES